MDLSFLGTSAEPTGVAAILVDGRGENMIAVASGANAVLDGRAVADAVRSVPAEAAVVLACLEVGEDAVKGRLGSRMAEYGARLRESQR